MYRHRNVQQIELLLVCLACAWIATACSGSDSQPVTGYVSYKPPVVPIIISLDTTGRISFSAEYQIEAPTPLGTFGVGAVVNPAAYFKTQSTLTVRLDGEDRIYDLHGQDFDVQFSSGYYEKIRLEKSGSNILLELRRGSAPPEVSVPPQVSAPPKPSVPSEASQPSTQAPPPTQAPTRSQPTPVPQNCQIGVHSGFLAVWRSAGGVAAGCPIGSAYQRRMGYQAFQNGFMIWRANSSGDAGGMIYVFLNSGKWQEYADQWVDGMAERSGDAPPGGLIEPRRGFGLLWRNELGGPNATIGWALSDESGSDSGLIQDFPNSAAILRFPGQPPVFAPDGRRWVK